MIETIDGRAVGRDGRAPWVLFNKQKKHVVSFVREREKKQIVLEAVE